MHELAASNVATGTNQIIGQIISGLILLVITVVARFLSKTNKAIERTADEQRIIKEAFQQHQIENDRDFYQITKFMKQQKKMAKRNEKAAHHERLEQVQERRRVAERESNG